MTTNPLSVALRYLAAGIPCLPCTRPDHPNPAKAGKAPTVEGWQSRGVVPAEAFRREYRPGQNLGVVMGRASGLVCVDIDPRNGGDRWYAANRDNLYGGVIERTGGGGLHVYFQYPSGRAYVGSLASHRNRIADGVDVLADGGHQVVTWPSVHPSGALYEWELGEDMDLVAAREEAFELPGWLLDLLPSEPPAPPVPVEGTGAGTGTEDHPFDVARARETLRRRPAAVQGRAGDMETFLAAAACRDLGLSDATTLQLLLEEYNPRCSPPWEPRDLAEKVRNAFKYAKGSKGALSITTDFEAVEVTATAETEPPLTVEEQESQEVAVIGPGKAAEKAFRKLMAEPLRCSGELLADLDGRVQIAGEVVYCYAEEERVWAVLSDTQFRAMVAAMLLLKFEAAVTVLDPSKVKKVADSIRLLLEHRRFDARPNTWLDGRRGNYVRLANGILDISGNAPALLDHSKEWFSFTKLPYAYDPEARCPEFLKFLQSIWPDDADAAGALQLWLGYLLLSEVLEQKFALLIGASRGGKGVLLRLMEKMIGRESTAACTITSIANEHGLAHLIGKSLAIFGDVVRAPGAAGEVATERLISIIGQDPQVINPKNGALFTAFLPLKIVMACNELPYFINSRQALSNRMLVFPFSESFAGREDAGLEKRLGAELPGILNWAILGARRLASGAEKLRMPKRAESVFLDIKKKLDSVFGFLTERGEVTSYVGWEDEYVERATETRAAYEAYQAWCKDNGHTPKSMVNFSDALIAYGGGSIERKRVRRAGRQPIVFVNFTLMPSEISDFN